MWNKHEKVMQTLATLGYVSVAVYVLGAFLEHVLQIPIGLG